MSAATRLSQAAFSAPRTTGRADDATGTLTVATRTLTFSTEGEGDVVNLTADLSDLLADTGLRAGTLTVFAPGATGAVTTLEFEPGVVHDFQRLFNRTLLRSTRRTSTTCGSVTATATRTSAPACWDPRWWCPSSTVD